MPRKSPAADQTLLPLVSQDLPEAVESHGVFSAGYLRRHLAASSDFPKIDEAKPTYEAIAELWHKQGAGLRKQKEAFTRTAFLDPVLKLLGWEFIPENSMPGSFATRKRPDYCLFSSDESYSAAVQAEGHDLFRLSASVLEAKQCGHPLHRISTKETPGWFPSQQIQDYLNYAKDGTGRRFFDWAILTNAKEWRLYTERSAVDAYFAFHLIDEDGICDFAEFQQFLALFRPAAFARDKDGKCFLDEVQDQSLRLQGELEQNLRKRIFDVLEDLGNGFNDHAENRLTPASYPAIYEVSLIFLYRLLFVLYAESRDLLPVKSRGEGANRRYREDFSLTRLVEQLRDKAKFDSNDFHDLYERLLKLFHLINGSNPRQNEVCKVTRYNGGLFNPDLHPNIERWRIGDRSFANILRQLIFTQPPSRGAQRQLQINTDETIDYSTLEVRQLGDIYEGLLGGQLALGNSRLQLQNENGENHRHGIFYTPDWVVRYLLRETIQPLLDQIEASPEVQSALAAKSEEKSRDNSFAHGVLRLNLVDPAMGSGHFLVRATEWLAEQILYHPTTRTMTIQIVTSGSQKITREQIIARGLIPVSPGISQEESEMAYWRRRVVEACIYGVDINPLAVELAKLSLWLTCIAVDEPLNFLDHHLRHGNSLLSVHPPELRRGPIRSPDDETEPFDLGNRLTAALSAIIRETVAIEELASTEMEVVKEKERRWKEVRHKIEPFSDIADLWIAALDGLPVNDFDYRTLATLRLTPDELSAEELTTARKLARTIDDDLQVKKSALDPFHWELEFPDVFYAEDGSELPGENRGFDAVLGNPPYISTHTSSGQDWRQALSLRAGWLEDLYVHFAQLGFDILRPDGGFGFIVSDTFFTLASKERMRRLLQENRLTHLGQCDPFDATVDAAIFVARKGTPPVDSEMLFVQARPLRLANGKRTDPEKSLPELPPVEKIVWDEDVSTVGGKEVWHGGFRGLRVHQTPASLYLEAHKRAFFEPRRCTLALFEKFNEPVKNLVGKWWEKMDDSRSFAEHMPEIRRYQQALKAGDVTIIGLIAEGGQGMRTANNARFLAYLEGTPQAADIDAKEHEWSRRWLADREVAPVFQTALTKHGGTIANPVANRAAWESAVHELREQFKPEKIGFTKSSLFRVAPKALVADESDFEFAWKQRKAALLKRWQKETDFKQFWHEGIETDGKNHRYADVEEAKTISDQRFCDLCQHLQLWIRSENAARKKQKKQPIASDAIGLRSSEDYSDPADAQRIAAIYNGLSGRGIFVPFRKGDPEGSRWVDNEPLFVDWSAESVDWLSTNPLARWQGHKFFFKTGVTWSLHANHVAVKSRLQEPCVFDASSSRLTPASDVLDTKAFLAVVNSNVFSFILKKFVKHNQDVEINDMRQLPIVIPTPAQERRLAHLAEMAIECKQLIFANSDVRHEFAAEIRKLDKSLYADAPAYLHPSAQMSMLTSPADCLAVIERSVNWEAEKLYGVESLGPFDEL